MKTALPLLLCLLLATPLLPVHAVEETDSMVKSCRKIAKFQGSLKQRAIMEGHIASFRSALAQNDDDRAEAAFDRLTRYCQKISPASNEQVAERSE